MDSLRPSWIDQDRVQAAKRRLPRRQAYRAVRTLTGARPSFSVATLKDYTQAHAFAKKVDGASGKGGFSPYMRHAR